MKRFGLVDAIVLDFRVWVRMRIGKIKPNAHRIYMRVRSNAWMPI